MALKISQKYRDIADKIIDKYPIAFSHIELDRVLFLAEDEKAPKKYADIRIIKDPYTIITNYKYIITVYEPMVNSMTNAQLHMVVYHELLHIDDSFDKLRKHNVEDFSELCSKFGVNWSIDPNLPDILEDNAPEPTQNDNSTPSDLNDEPDL